MKDEIIKTLMYKYYELALKYMDLAKAYVEIVEDKNQISEILETIEALNREQLTKDFITFTEL